MCVKHYSSIVQTLAGNLLKFHHSPLHDAVYLNFVGAFIKIWLDWMSFTETMLVRYCLHKVERKWVIMRWMGLIDNFERSTTMLLGMCFSELILKSDS